MQRYCAFEICAIPQHRHIIYQKNVFFLIDKVTYIGYMFKVLSQIKVSPSSA